MDSQDPRAGRLVLEQVHPFGRKKETAIVVLHVIRNGSNRLRVNGQSLETMCEFGERLWAGPLEPPHASEIED